MARAYPAARALALVAAAALAFSACGDDGAALGFTQQLEGPLRERPRIVRRGEEPSLAVDEGFWRAAVMPAAPFSKPATAASTA